MTNISKAPLQVTLRLYSRRPKSREIAPRSQRRREEIAEIARRSRRSLCPMRSHGDRHEVATRSQDRADVAEPSLRDLEWLQSY